MSDAVLDALGPVLTRWMMGGSALGAAPPQWREALGQDAGEAEIRLLALSGQYLGVLAVTEPAGEVRVPPDIPTLSNPHLPDPLRPRIRRLLQQLNQPYGRRLLLDFLDGRGWTMHPGDWMPAPNEEAPEVYAPWRDWAAAWGASAGIPAALTADEWHLHGPAARQAAFAALRRSDPKAAGTLLGEKIEGETADMRVRLVEALSIGLSDADRPLLERLAADRAPRVKTLAASLLARLGHGGGGGEDAVELAGFFSVETKGLLRRAKVVTPRALKTPAQRNRRAGLMEAVSFGAFGKALGLSEGELVEAWPWGHDGPDDCDLAAMAARSASDAVVAAIVDAVAGPGSSGSGNIVPLLPRLSRAQRLQAGGHLLRLKGATFVSARTGVGAVGGIDDAVRTTAGTALLAALKSGDAKHVQAQTELLDLGLLASRAGALQALEALAAVGVIPSDPRLDMLTLNAALEDRSDLRGGTT